MLLTRFPHQNMTGSGGSVARRPTTSRPCTYVYPDFVLRTPVRFARCSTDMVPYMRPGAVLTAITCKKCMEVGGTTTVRMVRIFMVWSAAQFAAHVAYVRAHPGVHDPGYCVEEVIISPTKAPSLGNIAVHPYVDIDVKYAGNVALTELLHAVLDGDGEGEAEGGGKGSAATRSVMHRLVCRACEVGTARLRDWLPPGWEEDAEITPTVTDGSRPGKMSYHIVWQCSRPCDNSSGGSGATAAVCVMRNVTCAHNLAAALDDVLAAEFGEVMRGAVDQVVYKESSQNMRIMGACKVGPDSAEIPGSELRMYDVRTGESRSVSALVGPGGDCRAAVAALKRSLITYVEEGAQVVYYTVGPYDGAGARGGIKRMRTADGGCAPTAAGGAAPVSAATYVPTRVGGNGVAAAAAPGMAPSGARVLDALAEAVAQDVLRMQGVCDNRVPKTWSGLAGSTLIVRVNTHTCLLQTVHTQTHYKVHVNLLDQPGPGVRVRDACDGARCREHYGQTRAPRPHFMVQSPEAVAALQQWRDMHTVAGGGAEGVEVVQ